MWKMEKVASHLPVPFKSDPETAVCWYGAEVDIEEDDENEDYEEDRIDELLCDLQDSLEAANEAMADVLIIAEELKELTGEDILFQLLQ